MHHYNAATAGISEFHGDLDLVIKTGAVSNQEYGFCFKRTDMFDCMSVMANLDPESIDDADDPDYASKFTLKDGTFTGTLEELAAANAITADRSQEDGPEFSWKNIAGKSFKTCALAEGADQPDDGNKIVTCKEVNAHWYRNFLTLQEDVALDIHQSPTTAYKVKGYIHEHTGSDLDGGKGEYKWGPEKMINLVTDNYQLKAKGSADGPTLGTNADEPIVTELFSDDYVTLTLGHYNTEGDGDNIFNES